LFDADAQLFDLSALTDLILSQPLLGSTVKVDGNETDPYAFLTVLNLEQHKVCEARDVEKLATNNILGHASHSRAH
jgi:BCCIP